MASHPGPESVSSYEGYDFRRMWAGREAVTELESGLVKTALAGAQSDRLLEAGTGFGRMSPLLAGLAEEYVGVDLDPSGLREIRDRLRAKDARGLRLLGRANLFHLPFVSGAFRTVVSIRVYHHIRDPAGFLGELARVLAPGGLLLLSYTPKPTIGTLEQDVRGFLHSRPTGLTWDRSDSRECGPDPFPIVVSTSARVRRDVRTAGFEVVRELGEGPERIAPWWPIRSLRGGTSTFPGSFLFPTRFLLARRTGTGPRCRAPTGKRSLDGSWAFPCEKCALPMDFRDGVLDAAFLPSGAEQWTIAPPNGPPTARAPGGNRTRDATSSDDPIEEVRAGRNG
ncbi:MAG: class I SAM-dependent methyltransferase [Thermoplasmata archaeon]|nr:class I SAM-dependent methyltransferase [Thermoplasmata archaeon]